MLDPNKIGHTGVYDNHEENYHEFWNVYDNGDKEVIAYVKMGDGVQDLSETAIELNNRYNKNKMFEAVENSRLFEKYPTIYSEYQLSMVEPIYDDYLEDDEDE